MKKVNRNKKKKRTSNQLIGFIVKHTNGLFLFFSIILSGLLIVRATYAWETYSSERENQFGSADFSVVLRENFVPNDKWEPGRQTVKEVYVANEGQYPAFVRLKAEEFLLNFEMDIEGQGGAEGTGNAKVYDTTTPTPKIDQADVTTWQKGEYYEKSQTSDRLKGLSTVPAAISITGNGLIYEKDKAARAASDLRYLTLNFGEVIDYTPTLTSQYWRYGNDGYFYYSERLEPGEVTTHFLKSASLSTSTPNRLKESLYKLSIRMDGDLAITTSLSEWNHDGPTDPIFIMLKNKVTSN
ncbi:hypothetical protein I6N95_15025 [Vagococcus sp. BWB3-3]|uniref:Alternate signal-mediated exported protein n=1 Tax=Vagococcus allomyrinae TaxID=2794353 RepID=A0A940P9Y3_9ENTE|nr:hypothetical protein [Vagococcus allomyrinae]